MKTLKEFYKSYNDWLVAGAPDGEPYLRSAGLCINLRRFAENHEPLQHEMNMQFLANGYRLRIPFNRDGSYFTEATTNTCHLNQMRINWVKDHVEE